MISFLNWSHHLDRRRRLRRRQIICRSRNPQLPLSLRILVLAAFEKCLQSVRLRNQFLKLSRPEMIRREGFYQQLCRQQTTCKDRTDEDVFGTFRDIFTSKTSLTREARART